METTVIVASRLKAARYLLTALACAAVLFVLPGRGGDAVRWVVEPFFGLCALSFAVLLVRPQRIALDAQGFALSGGFMRAPETVAWHAIGALRVVHVLGIALVGFDDATAATPPRLFRRIVGADAAFAGLWAQSSAALVDTLNAYRSRALKG